MKTLIRLGGCPGWSESSLGTQPHCWFCHEAAHIIERYHIYMWYLPEMSHKISKTYHFLPKCWNLLHLNERFSYIFYTFFINLTEMKGKSPWSRFETCHMFDHIISNEHLFLCVSLFSSIIWAIKVEIRHQGSYLRPDQHHQILIYHGLLAREWDQLSCVSQNIHWAESSSYSMKTIYL